MTLGREFFGIVKMTNELLYVAGGSNNVDMGFIRKGSTSFTSSHILPADGKFLTMVKVNSTYAILAGWNGFPKTLYQLDLTTNTLTGLTTEMAIGRSRVAAGLYVKCVNE